MIIIEQRQFEGRENLHIELKNPNAGNNTTIMAGNKSVYGQSDAAGTSGFFVKNQNLSKDVEKIFSRICQSIELYKTDNIPIITEFLEF